MHQVQLVVGWIAICALTAAGTYYGTIELDQDFGLQAKLCPKCAATVPAGGQTTPPPLNNTPAPNPGPKKPPQDRQNTPVYPPVNRTPTPPIQQNPSGQQNPPAGQNPYTPPPSSVPAVDMSSLVARYNTLIERANSINNEFAQIERDLRGQGQSLRGDIASARQSMVQNMNAAGVAIRARDASAASRALQVAEQKIDFLEQSR